VGRPPARGGNGQPDLEWHVESRGPCGKLNATEIVEGVPARRDQLKDSIQAPCGPRNLQRCTRAEPVRAEAGNQRNE